MKSFLIWIFCTLVGAGAGYGLSFLLDVHLYILIAFGVIIGSSAGVTWNLHREKEDNEDRIPERKGPDEDL